jgi:hypothetical protein
MPPTTQALVDQVVTIVQRKIEKLFIEFDGQQIEVLTDVPAAYDLFERAYGPMLVSRLTSRAGRIEVLEASRGYTIHGLQKTDFSRRPLNSFLDYLKHDVLLQFIKARPDLLWVHAAAVERDGSALLIVAPSGQGKSTLATLLCEAGWRLLSDDGAPIRMDVDVVIPFPQSALRRKYPRREFSEEKRGYFEKEEVPLPDTALYLRPAPIKAVVFPLFRNDAAPELELLSPGIAALDLLRNCYNFTDHKEAAVARTARLAASIPMYRLSYGAGRAAASLLDALE